MANFIALLDTWLADKLEYYTISKGEFLIREGEVEQYIYQVKDGAIRAYMLSENEELTIRFGYSGSIINALSSFYSGQPSQLFLQAIRKTTVRKIPATLFRSFIAENTTHATLYHQLLEQLVVQQIEREIDILTSSSAERLARVMERSPMLFQEVPLKYIAQYLRMAPETLSRLRMG